MGNIISPTFQKEEDFKKDKDIEACPFTGCAIDSKGKKAALVYFQCVDCPSPFGFTYNMTLCTNCSLTCHAVQGHKLKKLGFASPKAFCDCPFQFDCKLATRCVNHLPQKYETEDWNYQRLFCGHCMREGHSGEGVEQIKIKEKKRRCYCVTCREKPESICDDKYNEIIKTEAEPLKADQVEN